jgi:hypothetical protein
LCNKATSDIKPPEEDFIQAEGADYIPSNTLQIGAVGGGGAIPARDNITANEYASALDPLDHRQLHIFGVISYDDIFGNERKTRFGLYGRFDWVDLEDGKKGVEPFFINLGFHNEVT